MDSSVSFHTPLNFLRKASWPYPGGWGQICSLVRHRSTQLLGPLAVLLGTVWDKKTVFVEIGRPNFDIHKTYSSLEIRMVVTTQLAV